MGGVGKTTLAKVVFNRLSSQFQGCNFLSDVRESSERHGLVHLQKQLLSKFHDSRFVDKIKEVDDGINMSKRVLHNKKVLIVFDDVHEEKQLKNLAKSKNWFGSGSRVIITTRYKNFLMIDGEATCEGPIKSANVLTYEVQEMEFHHALELFSMHAFRRGSSPNDYVSLSKEVVSTLGKLPLALEVIASSLFGRSKEFWVDTLKKLEKAPPIEVQKTLRISYERLDDEQRQVFLDIACFFVNEDKTYPCYMWNDCDYYPHNAIEVLCLMSLIKIKDDNTFWMHDQLRDLGRAIVREENIKEPHKRSRVWNHQEAMSILEQKKGSEKIEALSLGSCREIISADEVANLQNLRFLKGNEMFLVEDFKNLLSNLKWLSWRWCPSEFVATNFHPINLIVLDLSHGYVSEKWIGWKQIRVAIKLKVVDLSNCKDLRRMPDLSTLVSLERLILEDCCNLIEIDPSIGKLKLLTTLNLNGCQSLLGLLYEIGFLENLKEMLLPCLPCGFKHPKTFGNLKSLSHSQFRILPNSIGGLVKLTQLNLYGCSKIKELPNSVGKLQSLDKLDLSLTSLRHLPNSISNLKQLRVLRMSHIIGITKLPGAIGQVENLEVLDASGCHHLTGEIPEEIGRLPRLRILDLSFTRISGLPTTVSGLSNLQTLNLESCPKLDRLPKLPTSLNCLRWALDTLKLFGKRTYVLRWDSACHCSTVPLYEVEELASSGKTQRSFPKFLSSSLRELELGHVTRELKLGNVSMSAFEWCENSHFKNLSTLRLQGCLMYDDMIDVDLVVSSFKVDRPVPLELKRLRHLEMNGCTFEQEALNLSHMKNLEEVNLFGCLSLVEICGLEELGSLCFLTIVDCSSMERMSNLSKLRKLRKLRIGECPKLRSVEGLNHLESIQKLWIHNCYSLESLANTSNLRLECSKIEHCARLPNRNSYCRCHDNSDSVFTELDHAKYF